MRGILCGLLLLVTSVANAQPGQTQPGPYTPPQPPPQPQPYPAGQPAPAPQPYAPPAYGYVPPVQVQLTQEDQELLARGEISDGEHIGGGVLAIFVGFGAGQAVQGRWGDTGWIFTLGEAATFGAMMYGLTKDLTDCFETNCDSSNHTGLIVAGALGFTVLRLWETIDAFAGPASHNRRVRDLRMRLGGAPQYYGLRPYVAPPRAGDGAIAGVSLQF
jgi:hypothetical protein